MNAKFLEYFIYVEMIIYVLLHNGMTSPLIKNQIKLSSRTKFSPYCHLLLT